KRNFFGGVHGGGLLTVAVDTKKTAPESARQNMHRDTFVVVSAPTLKRQRADAGPGGCALLSLVLTRSSSRVWCFSTISAPDLGRSVHPGARTSVAAAALQWAWRLVLQADATFSDHLPQAGFLNW